MIEYIKNIHSPFELMHAALAAFLAKFQDVDIESNLQRSYRHTHLELPGAASSHERLNPRAQEQAGLM